MNNVSNLFYLFFLIFIIIGRWEECLGQKLDHITHIPNYNLEYGSMIYDGGDISFIGDIVDTNGYSGYYIGRLDIAGQFSCFRHYIDSSRVKHLIFAPSIKIDEGMYATMGFSWNKSRPMLVVFNDQCDTLFTREYVVEPDDSLSYQVMEELIKIPGVGYAVVGQLAAYETRVDLRSQTFIMLLDEEFNIIWQEQYGGAHSDYGICADLLGTDTLLVFGIEHIGLYAWPNTPLSRFMRVMKISLADGHLLWEKKDIAPHRMATFDYVRSPLGGYVLCAAELFDSLYANGMPGNYYTRNSVFHLDSTFEISWEVNYGEKFPVGGLYSDITESINDDGVVAVGTALEVIGDSLTYSTVVSKLSWNGDSIWTRYYLPVHESLDVLYSIPSSPDDQIVTTENGYILQTDLRLDTLESEYPYKEQIWFLELDEHGCHIPGCHLISSSEDIPLENHSEVKLHLYPNPASDILTVQVTAPQDEITELTIWDAQGQRVMSTPFIRQGIQYLFPLRSLQPGYYILVASKNGEPIAAELFIRSE